MPQRRDITIERCCTLNQIWSQDIWPAFPRDAEARPPTNKKTITTRNDQLISDIFSYNDDESEDDYLEKEISDDRERSEDEDVRSHNTHDVPPDSRNSTERASEHLPQS